MALLVSNQPELFEQDLRRFGRGDGRITIAVIDGPVDFSHPCLRQAGLTILPTLVSSAAAPGVATAHGTYVASILFGQPDSPVEGIVPSCSGLVIPVFSDQHDRLACSQLDLARAILLAIERGAHIINISGGQLAANGEADGFLAQAIDACAQRNILVVAAAGNDGCDCLHVPAAIETVLAVGAMARDGRPLASSNWGNLYATQGLLAPGEAVIGAALPDGTARRSGTSFAAPYVTGVAALLIARQLARGEAPDPHAVRAAILQSATACSDDGGEDCRRVLAGRINVEGAFKLVERGSYVSETTWVPSSVSASALGAIPRSVRIANDGVRMSEDTGIAISPDPTDVIAAPEILSRQIAPSCGGDEGCSCGGKKSGDCGCGCGGHGAEPKKPQLVYALGRVGYDFGTEARRDSYLQAMALSDTKPFSDLAMLEYLAADPSEAQGLIWTLNLDATPIYAIQPVGAFAALGYERLREFLNGSLRNGVELVSVPGVIGGTVRLQSGQVVPVIVPAIRGMFAWAVAPLVQLALGARPPGEKLQVAYDDHARGLSDFLNRVYYDLRNLGVTPEDRALNYSATNAVQIADVVRSTTREALDLDTLHVKRSPICRPDSDCYDVEISFFNPNNTNIASRIYRFTVDVSDIIPVSIGPTRSWTRR